MATSPAQGDQLTAADQLRVGEIVIAQKEMKKDAMMKKACLSGYHPHPLYVVCTLFPE